MPRYIDADYLDELITQLNHEGRGITRNEYKVISNILFEFPTADVVEIEGSKVGKYLSYTTTGIQTDDVQENVHAHAHWKIVYDEDCDGGGKYICGNCKHAFSFGAYFELCRFDYCPNCGARLNMPLADCGRRMEESKE